MRAEKYIKHFFIFLALCLLVGCQNQPAAPRAVDPTVVHHDDAQAIYAAFQDHRSNLFVESKGQVVKILPDDIKGSPHQRFVLQLGQGQTILIAHNIDLASRVDQLALGDEVYFSGEYEWSREGGVIHKTHHDPRYRRDGGWLEHKGVRYQ